jgi:hypothetical protein
MATEPELRELAEDVASEIGRPLDVWAVAATLESKGLRDIDAAEHFGRADIFGLAETVYPLALTAEVERLPSKVEPPHGPSALRSYLRGAFFFVPLALQAAALLLIGYSQWASLRFSLAQASAIAVAVGASFVATAGCSQTLGRLGPVFEVPGNHRLTERMAYGVLLLGAMIAIAVGVVLWLVATLSGAYPAELARTGAVYFLLLALLWLATASLYMLRAYAAMVLATIAGLAVAAALRSGAGTGLYAAQWAGIGTSAAFSLAWTAVCLRLRAGRTTGERRLARLPPLASLRRLATPYFVYGTLYFSFIFVDRVVAWTTGAYPLPLWFRVHYELGLDGALVAIVLGMAFLEVLVTAFPRLTERLQVVTSAEHVSDHNRAHLRFHLRQLAIVGALVIVGIAIVSLAALAAIQIAGPGHVRAQLTDPVTRSVFAFGVAGYALLCVGLANTVLLFSLARPWSVVRSLAPALAVDVAVGIVLSRTGPYWHSVLGLVAGALVFAVLSGIAVRRAAHEADYAYYASF